MKDYTYLDGAYNAAGKPQDTPGRADPAEVDSLKRRLREYVERITERNGRTKLYNCPLCGSGTGPNGTGAFSLFTGKDGFPLWKCQSCGKSGDIFQLIAEHEGIKDFPGQLSRARELVGTAAPQLRPQFPKRPQAPKQTPEEIKAFCEEMAQNINAPEAVEYLRTRGITDIESFTGCKIGFCPEWRGADGQHAPSARLIIPFDYFTGYLARAIEEDAKQPKLNAGETATFCAACLIACPEQPGPAFIVEGALDAMSIIQAGGYACALNSANNTAKLLSFLDSTMEAGEQIAPLILALDNDTRGREAQAGLAEDLKARGVFFTEVSESFYTEKEKDANALLTADAAALVKKIKQEEYFAKEAKAAAMEEREAKEAAAAEAMTEEAAAYMDTFNGPMLAGFWNDIKEGRKEYISTGFPALDSALEGGIYPKLHMIGAISSLGKTTYFIQLIDQLAQQGHEVLFFSLETPLKSIMAKSISRHTYTINKEYAKTERDILNSGLEEWTQAPGHVWGKEDFDIIREAGEAYAAYAGNIKVYDTRAADGVAGISGAIEKHIQLTGRTPAAVFIDYLQLIPAPKDAKSMTDKERADYNSAALVGITRAHSLPVFCISSLNRASYMQPVEMESFKESGGIEYNTDVLMALQYTKMELNEGEGFSLAAERVKAPRDITLKILKNRGAAVGGYIRHEYTTMYNHFSQGKAYNPIEAAKEEKSAGADGYRKPRSK